MKRLNSSLRKRSTNMTAVFLLTLCLVSILQSALATQSRRKYDREESDAYRDLRVIRDFNQSIITWRIDRFTRSSNLSNADLTHVIRTATGTWADVIPVDFLQSFNASEEVDIIVRFLDSPFDEIPSRPLSPDEMARCIHDTPKRIIFNGDVKFVIGNGDSRTNIDIFTVALHEFGHALGLRGHSTNPNSLMAGGYSGRITELSDDVIRDIQALYGVRTRERSQKSPLQCPSTTCPERPQCPSCPTPAAITDAPFANASFQYCTTGEYYCGWQLQEMGYRFEEEYERRRIYLCGNNSEDISFHICSYGMCVVSEKLGSHCPCRPGWRYCGHVMEDIFFMNMSKWHAVYECAPTGREVQLIELCPDICINDICTSARGTCDDYSLYCGRDILHRGLASPLQKVDLNAVYRCNDTRTPVHRCHGRCFDNDWGNASC